MAAVDLRRSPNYRPDIDGLRALAVLSVVLFHINASLLPGGFVGVDVFFVISGYLITLNIANEIDAGRFTILDFYRRRIKRIAPAMLVCVASVIVLAQLLTIPEDAERAAESAIWSLASLANVYFWLFQDQSYFAQDSRELPFLHLWSLGVEEQFYLVWPLLMMLLLPRFRWRSLLAGLGCAAILSYVMGQIVFRWSPSFAYYMIPTRAGELLVGAILAITVARGGRLQISSAQAQVLGLSGLALMVASFFALSEEDIFPGLRALPPTLGTVMLIAAGQTGCRVSKALSITPLVWIGLVSYSAYLWHWPLLAFLRYGFGEIRPSAGIAAFILTFLLAGLSYKFVEQPARRARWGPWKVVFGQLVLPGAVIGGFCMFLMATDAMRFRPAVADFEQMRPAYAYDYVCQRWLITDAIARSPDCIVGTGNPESTKALLWGDSNAAHYVGAIASFANDAGFTFRNLEPASCPPLLNDPTKFLPARRVEDCVASMAAIKPIIESADVVIVSAAWPSYQKRDSAFLSEFLQTVKLLVDDGKQVIIIGKAASFPRYDRKCMQKAQIYPFIDCGRSSAPANSSITAMNAELRDFATAEDRVKYFDLNDILCNGGVCSPLTEAGVPLYYDSEHLSIEGSWYLGRKYLEDFGFPPAFASLR